MPCALSGQGTGVEKVSERPSDEYPKCPTFILIKPEGVGEKFKNGYGCSINFVLNFFEKNFKEKTRFLSDFSIFSLKLSFFHHFSGFFTTFQIGTLKLKL